MKTQIIQLEAHDDVISTRDKMGAGQASRILLVWPTRTHFQIRRLDLVLLQRHSNSLGAQLGLVTTDEETIFYARELGLPTFNSLKQAQGDRWRQTRRRRLRLKKPLKRAIPVLQQQARSPQMVTFFDQPEVRLTLFSLSIVALLALLAFVLPGARIIINPHREQQSVTLTVKSNPAIKDPLLAGELPIHTATVIVEGRDSLPASGKIRVPEKSATGKVVFTNLTQEPVAIPVGTIVTTLDVPVIRFTTSSASIIKAGIGQSTTIPVKAVVPGATGNLPASHLQAIEGPIGLSLTVDNPEPTRQGTDRPAISPTQADRDKLYQLLSGNLENTARQELANRLSANNEITDFSLLPTLLLSRVLEETYTPSADQPADQVELLLRLEFAYQFVSATDLQKLATPILEAAIPDGYRSLPGTLRIEHGQVSLDKAGIATWQLHLRQDLEKIINLSQAADIAHGLTVDRARRQLSAALELDESPQIKVMPFWWPYLPYLTFRIGVILASSEN